MRRSNFGLGLAFFIFVFQACQMTPDEEKRYFLKVEMNPSLTTLDTVLIIAKNSSGLFEDTLFANKFALLNQTSKLAFRGDPNTAVELRIVGILRGVIVYEEFRKMDFENPKLLSITVTQTPFGAFQPIIIDPNKPSPIFPLEPIRPNLDLRLTVKMDSLEVSVGDTVTFEAEIITGDIGLSQLEIRPFGDESKIERQLIEFKEGKANFNWAYLKTGRFTSIITLIDTIGNVRNDTTYVYVILDAPKVHAGNDTAVRIGEEFKITGTATQKFGKFVSYAWDFNNDGIVDDSSSYTPTGTFRFLAEGDFSARFIVRDDDGNVSSALRNIIATNSLVQINQSPRILDFKGPRRLSIGDSGSFTAQVLDDTLVNKAEWNFEGDSKPEKILVVNSKIATIEQNYRYEKPGNKTIILTVSDFQGKIRSDSTLVVILEDIPTVDAGLRQTGFVGEPIVFNGNASQEFGSFVDYAWDFEGDGKIDFRSPVSPRGSYSYTKAGFHKVYFWVKDDDGMVGFDSTEVVISSRENKPPQIILENRDTIITRMDSIQIVATLNDPDGTLLRYGFDFNDDGKPEVEFSGGTPQLRISRKLGFPEIGLTKVTLILVDNEGGTSQASFKVNVIMDMPVAKAGEDTTIVAGSTITLHGKGSDGMGFIKKMEWKAIGGAFVSSLDGQFASKFDIAGSFQYIFQTTDDDDLKSQDTLTVLVKWHKIIVQLDTNGIAQILDTLEGAIGKPLEYNLKVPSGYSLESWVTNPNQLTIQVEKMRWLQILAISGESSILLAKVVRKRILCFNKPFGFKHGSLTNFKKLIDNLGQQMDFEITHSIDSSIFMKSLDQYQVIILNQVSHIGKGLPDPIQRKNFQDFALAKKGVIAFHASLDEYYFWGWYTSYVGATLLNHSPGQLKATLIKDSDIEGFPFYVSAPDSQVQDEWYNLELSPRGIPGTKIVFTIDTASYFFDMGKEIPVAWIREQEKGRAFFTSMGHDENINSQFFQRLLISALDWTSFWR